MAFSGIPYYDEYYPDGSKKTLRNQSLLTLLATKMPPSFASSQMQNNNFSKLEKRDDDKENIPPESLRLKNNLEKANKELFKDLNSTKIIHVKTEEDSSPKKNGLSERKLNVQGQIMSANLKTENKIQPAVIVKSEPTEHSTSTMKNEYLKWGTIIPLIGGSSIGCSRSAGNLPAFHLTYTPFKNNETHLEKYWPQVPKYYIDKNQEPEDIEGKKRFLKIFKKRKYAF